MEVFQVFYILADLSIKFFSVSNINIKLPNNPFSILFLEWDSVNLNYSVTLFYQDFFSNLNSFCFQGFPDTARRTGLCSPHKVIIALFTLKLSVQ